MTFSNLYLHLYSNDNVVIALREVRPLRLLVNRSLKSVYLNSTISFFPKTEASLFKKVIVGLIIPLSNLEIADCFVLSLFANSF